MGQVTVNVVQKESIAWETVCVKVVNCAGPVCAELVAKVATPVPVRYVRQPGIRLRVRSSASPASPVQ